MVRHRCPNCFWRGFWERGSYGSLGKFMWRIGIWAGPAGAPQLRGLGDKLLVSRSSGLSGIGPQKGWGPPGPPWPSGRRCLGSVRASLAERPRPAEAWQVCALVFLEQFWSYKCTNLEGREHFGVISPWDLHVFRVLSWLLYHPEWVGGEGECLGKNMWTCPVGGVSSSIPTGLTQGHREG